VLPRKNPRRLPILGLDRADLSLLSGEDRLLSGRNVALRLLVPFRKKVKEPSLVRRDLALPHPKKIAADVVGALEVHIPDRLSLLSGQRNLGAGMTHGMR
jgi:hypothetical protein